MARSCRHLVMESDSVCDCGTGWRGSDTMGLMLTRAPPPTPLATPSLRMIWVPGVMGVLAGGRELYTRLMSAAGPLDNQDVNIEDECIVIVMERSWVTCWLAGAGPGCWS